jgi:hypothetical protein
MTHWPILSPGRPGALFFAPVGAIHRHVAYAYLPTGFIEPCLPAKADTLPSGGLWIHEINLHCPKATDIGSGSIWLIMALYFVLTSVHISA